MAKRSEKEYFLGFVVLTVVVLLLVGFYFAWVSIKHRDPVAYAQFKSVVISNQIYAIKTNISVQVATENKDWLLQHQASLENVLRNTLAETDPKVATGPNALIDLQEALKNAGNNAFNTDRILNVYFTDFVLVRNGSQ